MQKYPEIKQFVQETLGCSCPEEVFNKIDYQKEIDGMSGRKVTVGDRLLIYIISTDRESNIQGVIDSALEQGVEERDKKRLNRFRLVLASSRPVLGELLFMRQSVFERDHCSVMPMNSFWVLRVEAEDRRKRSWIQGTKLVWSSSC